MSSGSSQDDGWPRPSVRWTERRGGARSFRVFCGRVSACRSSPTPVRLACRGSLLSLIELLDLDLSSLGEDSRDLQLPSHGANKMLKRADVHIRAPFHLGYGGLLDFQNPGKMLLRHRAGFPEFIQGHLGAVLGRELIRPCPGSRRHFLPRGLEIPGHTLPLPSMGRVAHFSRPSVRWTERRACPIVRVLCEKWGD